MTKETSNEIKKLARELGYADCGIAPTGPFTQFGEQLTMRGLAFPEARKSYESFRNLEDPASAFPGAKSLIVCVRRYGTFKLDKTLQKYFAKYYLFETGLPYKRHEALFAAFTSGLSRLGIKAAKIETASKQAAVRAGVGRFGGNNLIYTANGSWVAFDVWATAEELEYDEPSCEPACIPGCRRCIDACPTGAIVGKFNMNMNRCVTEILSSGVEVSEELEDKLGTKLYGCDVCQDVCPLNRGKWSEETEFEEIPDFLKNFSPEKILALDDREFATLVAKFGFIRERGNWNRNAERALRNERAR